MVTEAKVGEKYDLVATPESVGRTARALEKNGITTFVFETGAEAKAKVVQLLPSKAEVMNMTSMTLEAISLATEINESGRYDSVRNRLSEMDPKTQWRDMRHIGAAPDWVVGSVHAVTEDGHLLIASRTGSQLPAYAYAGQHVIWVIGAQKIVRNIEEGIGRIYEYSFPREDDRSLKAYGVHSGVNKILIVNEELIPGRITAILVNEKLGF